MLYVHPDSQERLHRSLVFSQQMAPYIHTAKPLPDVLQYLNSLTSDFVTAVFLYDEHSLGKDGHDYGLVWLYRKPTQSRPIWNQIVEAFPQLADYSVGMVGGLNYHGPKAVPGRTEPGHKKVYCGWSLNT